MIAQNTPLVNPVVKQQPVTRVRRWNRTAGRYEWAVVTQQQIEATRRREQYVAAFNPCDVA
jgi:hypothetical protein